MSAPKLTRRTPSAREPPKFSPPYPRGPGCRTRREERPMDALEGMLAALDLVDTGARTDEDIFTGLPQWNPQGRLFGGQVLAQSVVAASRTAPADRQVHSMHGYFLRPG